MRKPSGEQSIGWVVLERVAAGAFTCLLTTACAGTTPDQTRPDSVGSPPRPNIVLILTDDQGYGDLGAHGNEAIRTPHLDAFTSESVRLDRFYVSPVCSPTRASLLTGRYNYRTGVVDTFLGRSLMHEDEVTLAERLRDAGYHTGIFGKWHLGDNHPIDPRNQGFDEAMVIRGGGLGQPSDPPDGSSYFDPLVLHNGRLVRTDGYCTDVFTDGALDFIERHRDGPFFAYVSYNAPHTPLEVADAYRLPYAQQGLDDTTARVYGMVTNIDDNAGRLLQRLDELDLGYDTIVIFMTDNGPQHDRYNAGMRGRKGTVFDGGIRVPGYVRWPAALPAGHNVEPIAAHIDVLPTLLEAAGVPVPAGSHVDGTSLLPLLRGEEAHWPDRTLFFQWHRGDEPERGRAFAALEQRWKLVSPNPIGDAPAELMLFDLQADPGETTDMAASHPAEVERLRSAYDRWFSDVSTTRGFDPPRIHIGSEREDPVVLTRQDWRGPRANWSPTGLGYWEVDVVREAAYDVVLRFTPHDGPRMAHFRIGAIALSQPVAAGTGAVTFTKVSLPTGPARVEPWLERDRDMVGVHFVEVAAVDGAGSVGARD